MARKPEKDYKILKSNNTTYNFLSQTQRHVPDTPLFKPGEEPSYNVGVRGGDRADNGEWKRHQTPDRGGNYASDDRRGPGPEPDFGKDEPAYNPTTTTTNPINNNNYDYSNNYTSRKNVIAHDEHHVPVSPLYRGGGGRQPRKQDYDDSNRQGGGGRGYGGMRERDSSPGLQDPRMGEQVPPYFNEREQPREDTPGEYYQAEQPPPSKEPKVDPLKRPNKETGALFDTFRGEPQGTTLPLHRYEAQDKKEIRDKDESERLAAEQELGFDPLKRPDKETGALFETFRGAPQGTTIPLHRYEEQDKKEIRDKEESERPAAQTELGFDPLKRPDKETGALFETFRGAPQGTTLPLHRYEEQDKKENRNKEEEKGEEKRDPNDLFALKMAAHEARLANNQRSVLFDVQGHVPNTPLYKSGYYSSRPITPPNPPRPNNSLVPQNNAHTQPNGLETRSPLPPLNLKSPPAQQTKSLERHYSPPPRWATRRKWPDGDFRPPVRPHWSIQGDKPLLSDRNHLPNSPLYKGSGPGTLRPINRPESISGNMDDLKLPLEGVTSPAPVLPPVNTSQRAPLAPFNYKSGGGLSHRDHVPDSPLYRGGYRPPHHHEEMPDPSYNTTHLRFDEGKRRAEDPDYYRKQPMSSREHDIRDYRGNPMPNRGPYTDRGDYYERDPRNHPWEHPANVKGNMSDPRFGAGSRGDAFHSAPSKHGGALLFIRFQTNEGEKIPVVSQAFKRATLQDTGGRYLGMSKRVYDFGPDKSPNEAIGVFHFPNMDNALKFFQYDFNIRQPDFPGPYGTASMWIVCNAYLPDNMDVFNTFLLSEITLHKGREKRAFFEEFQKKFEQYLYKNGVMPFVVCSYGNHDRQSIRRHAYQPDKIVTCHLFQGLDHLRWLAEQNEYCKFRSLHNTWATEVCSVFSLSKEL